MSAAKLVGTTETLLSSATISGLTYTPNQVLKLRFQAVGAGSTALKAKVWKGSDAEPTAWLVSATDTEPTLQTAGSIGVISYLTSTSTSAPVSVSIDNLKVTAP